MFQNQLIRANRFLYYWLNAVDEHSLQAPFIFDFYQHVIKDKSINNLMEAVLKLRKSLQKNHRGIQVTDLGAGNDRYSTRTISGMARNSHQPQVSRWLFNICRRYHPKTILELGANLGLSTLSMAAGAKNAKIVTIEGCPKISQLAKEHFSTLNAPQIELIVGDIEDVLPEVLTNIGSIDLLFMDANHRYQPTINYFSQCVSRCHAQSMVVVDDIYHSAEMNRAWEEIKQWPGVRLTIDLFRAGLVFFDPQLTKSHYVLQY